VLRGWDIYGRRKSFGGMQLSTRALKFSSWILALAVILVAATPSLHRPSSKSRVLTWIIRLNNLRRVDPDLRTVLSTCSWCAVILLTLFSSSHTHHQPPSPCCCLAIILLTLPLLSSSFFSAIPLAVIPLAVIHLSAVLLPPILLVSFHLSPFSSLLPLPSCSLSFGPFPTLPFANSADH
jgi:hypothetical protein